MKKRLQAAWRVFPQAALPVACQCIGWFLVSFLLLVAGPGFAQDVLWGVTSNGGPEGAGTAFSVSSTGADFTVHKAFVAAPANPTGSLVQGRDGYFYGVTMSQHNYSSYLATFGSVFKVSPSGQLTVLKSFNFYDGAFPMGGLVEGRDGNFYGMTNYGGSSFAGTVFKISPAGAFTLLHSFDRSSEGGHPLGRLVEGSDGNFYGMTSDGGSNSAGTIFKISPAGQLTVLKSFDYADGAWPAGSLVEGRDGDFYGLAANGGSDNAGTAFKISPAGAFTVLKNFNSSDGANPMGGLVGGRDGDFYGMTYSGGEYGAGTVFKMSPTGAFTLLTSFGQHYASGANPMGDLVEGRDGDFYGLTNRGGLYGYGTVFKISPAGTFTPLKDLGADFTAGIYPQGSLVQGTDGNFYGTTYSGGESYWSGFGTIFSISPAGAFAVLNNFSYSDGSYPTKGLVKGRDGNFYGMTSQGGTHNLGTFFKIGPDGTHTVLKNLAELPGFGYSPEAGSFGSPWSNLVEGRDGYFYGVTQQGGRNWGGTIFKISPTGAFALLKELGNVDGIQPMGSLVQGRDGNFYGVTQAGGERGHGTVFKISPAGAFAVLKSFNFSDGANPLGGLAEGSDGDFYGTTSYGGSNYQGTVFKISPAGTHTVLKAFAYGEGGSPAGSLVEASDGNFYGITSMSNNAGTIFRISPEGTHTVLKEFNGFDGADPRSGLVEGSNGDLYGMTYQGGSDNRGTLFKISLEGTYTVLRSFTEADGVSPLGSLFVEKPACTSPVLTSVPADITVNAGAMECGASVTFAASATGTPAPGILYKAGEDVITSPHVFPVGTTTVTAIAVNGCGRVTKSFTVTVVDKTAPVPWTASLPDVTGECAARITETPAANDNCGGMFVPGTTTDPLEYTAQGTYIVTWTYRDESGNTTTQTQKVVVKDETSPAIAAPAALTLTNAAGQCGRPLADVALGLPLTSDNCAGIKAATHDAPAFLPVGTTTVTWTVEDAAGNRSTATQRLTLTNAGPVLAGITAPLSPVAINSTVSASADFGDNNLREATWDWGNGTSPGTIDAVSGKITGSRSYSTPGVHTVTLSVTDVCGATATASLRYVVVYDPSGGFVTGGGWFNSPAGAYAPNPSATGKAHFGFVSRYQKGASQPVGATHLEFEAAGMAFHSSSYEWLVVAGGQAQYKGTGTLNGQGGYKFLLTAVDGQMNGGTGSDRLRIKIWQEGQPLAEYDNQRGAADEAPAATALGGGSILVHEERSKARQPGPVGGEGSLAGATLSGYPNPFTGSTTLAFTLGSEEEYALEVYDLKGRLVARLGAGRAAAGAANRVEWEAKAAPAGVYFARLTTRSGVQHLKLVLR